jgi:hypothetical protein
MTDFYGSLSTPTRTSAPTGTVGDLYFDSTTSRLYSHDGTVWRYLKDTDTVSSIEWYGHSIVNLGATDRINGTSQRASQLLGAEAIDRSSAGAVLAWHEAGAIAAVAGNGGWAHIYRNTDVSTSTVIYEPKRDTVIIDFGINDLVKIGTNSAPFINSLTAAISRFNAAAVFEESHASVAYGGAWNAQTTGAATAPALWASNNSYASCTSTTRTVTVTVPSDFPGGTVALGFLCDSSGHGAQWSISVDGGAATLVEARAVNAKDWVTGSEATWSPVVYRATGLAAGTHTIIATVNAISTTAYFDAWWIEAASPPQVGVVQQYKLPSYAFYTALAVPYPPVDADIDTLNGWMTTVVGNFSNAFTIPTDDVINKSSTLLADGLHPNDRGHALIAARIADYISRNTPRSRSVQAEGRFNPATLSRHPNSSKRNLITAEMNDIVPLTVRARNGNDQTANLQNWENYNGGTVLLAVNSTGKLIWQTDTNLYRALAAVLATDGTFIAGAGVQANTGLATMAALGYTGPSTLGAGVAFGTSLDTNIYRSGANILSTDDTFTAGGGVIGNFGVANQTSVGYTASGVSGAGMTFGSAGDTNIYRNGSDSLKTDDAFTVAGVFAPLGGILLDLSTWFAIPHLGNNGFTTPTASTSYYGQVWIPTTTVITGVNLGLAGTGGSITARSSMYNAAGTRVANRTTNSAAASSLTSLKVAFDSTYVAVPGYYFISLTFNNVSTNTVGMTTATVPCASAAGPGSGATIVSITPPTTAGVNLPTMSTY